MFNPSQAHLENIFLTKQFAPWLAAQGHRADVVVSPDVGYLENARLYAEELSADLAALSKERDYSKPNSVSRSTLIGEVEGRDVLLVDDIIDTAGSVVSAVSELLERGAHNITVACVHPVFSGPAWERLLELKTRSENENWSFKLIGTSSIHHPNAPDWYQPFPIEPLVAAVLEKINLRGSVSGVQNPSRAP